MARCEAGGTTITCPKGCYMVCTSDGSSCSGGCEPATALPMPLRLAKGLNPLDVEIVFCAKQLEPGTLPRVLEAIMGVSLLAEEATTEATAPIQFKGKFRDLLAQTRLKPSEDKAV